MSNPNKKLLASYFFPPQIGGIENYYLNLLSHFSPEEISVLCQSQPGDKEFDLTQPYHIYRTEFFAGRLPPRWLKLQTEIKGIMATEKATELIFGHFHPLNIIGSRLKVPYYVFGHGTDIRKIKENFWQKFIFKRVYRDCQGIITNSNYLAEEIGKLIGGKEKVKVVYPGVNIDRLNQPVADFDGKRDALGISADDLVILSMGRLVKDKNYETIIKIMPALLNLLPNIKYVIVGDGPELENLKALADQADLRNKVIFIGGIKNDDSAKAFYYQLAHVYVGVSAIAEGLGVSYLEAQACRTPVVASKHGGSAEAVIDGETGILADPKDQEEIVKALYRILIDKELWEKLAAAGQERVKKEFDWKLQAGKIKEILK
jgi:phosphatidylinositol alpha-1,6-mannosyltransferase